MSRQSKHYKICYQKREGGQWNCIGNFNIYSSALDAYLEVPSKLDDGDVALLTAFDVSDSSDSLSLGYMDFSRHKPRKLGLVIGGQYAKLPRCYKIVNSIGEIADLQIMFSYVPLRDDILTRACFWRIDRRKVMRELLQLINYRFTSDLLDALNAYANNTIHNISENMQIAYDSDYVLGQDEEVPTISIEEAVKLINQIAIVKSDYSAGIIAGIVFRAMATLEHYNNNVAYIQSISLGEFMLAGHKNMWKWRWAGDGIRRQS